MNEQYLVADVLIYADESKTEERIEVGVTGPGELHNIYTAEIFNSQ